MEGVRRRKPTARGDHGPEGKSGEEGRSAKIDHTCTYLILLVTVSLLSCCLLVWLLPDHPLAALLVSTVDRTAHLLSLTTPTFNGNTCPQCTAHFLLHIYSVIWFPVHTGKTQEAS